MKKMSSAIKKKNILLFVTTWMDLESNMLSEINQTEKGKYCGIWHNSYQSNTWSSVSVCLSSAFSLKTGLGCSCTLFFYDFQLCENVMPGAATAVLWRWGELAHRQMMANRTDGKNLGQPDSIEQLSSLLLKTQPTPTTPWLNHYEK